MNYAELPPFSVFIRHGRHCPATEETCEMCRLQKRLDDRYAQILNLERSPKRKSILFRYTWRSHLIPYTSVPNPHPSALPQDFLPLIDIAGLLVRVQTGAQKLNELVVESASYGLRPYEFATWKAYPNDPFDPDIAKVQVYRVCVFDPIFSSVPGSLEFIDFDRPAPNLRHFHFHQYSFLLQYKQNIAYHARMTVRGYALLDATKKTQKEKEETALEVETFVARLDSAPPDLKEKTKKLAAQHVQNEVALDLVEDYAKKATEKKYKKHKKKLKQALLPQEKDFDDHLLTLALEYPFTSEPHRFIAGYSDIWGPLDSEIFLRVNDIELSQQDFLKFDAAARAYSVEFVLSVGEYRQTNFVKYRNRYYTLAQRNLKRHLNQEKKHQDRLRATRVLTRELEDSLTAAQRKSRKRAQKHQNDKARMLKVEYQGLVQKIKDLCTPKIEHEIHIPLIEGVSMKELSPVRKFLSFLLQVFAGYRLYKLGDWPGVGALISAFMLDHGYTIIEHGIKFAKYLYNKLDSLTAPVIGYPFSTPETFRAYKNSVDQSKIADYELEYAHKRRSGINYQFRSGDDWLAECQLAGTFQNFLTFCESMFEKCSECRFVESGVPILPVEHQAEGDEPSSSFLAIVSSFIFGSKATSFPQSSVSTLAKEFNAIATATKHIRDFTKMIQDLVIWSIGVIYEASTGEVWMHPSEVAIIKRARSFLERARPILLTYPISYLDGERGICQEILALHRDACDISREMTARGIDSKFPQEFMKVHTDVAEYAVRANKILQTSPVRIQPVWVNITGAPRTGKTFITNYMLGYVWKALGRKGTFALTDRYEKKHLSEFWDGYHDQWACTIDDVFQSRDQKDRRMQAVELIQVVNDCLYPLNMAHLEDKGTTWFSSKIVVTTTNTNSSKWTDLGIQEPQALFERISLDFVQHIHKEFGIEKPDKGGYIVHPKYRLNPNEALEARHFEPWYFEPSNTKTAELMTELYGVPLRGYSFRQVVDAIARLMRINEDRSDAMDAQMQNLPELQGLYETTSWAVTKLGLAKRVGSFHPLTSLEYKLEPLYDPGAYGPDAYSFNLLHIGDPIPALNFLIHYFGGRHDTEFYIFYNVYHKDKPKYRVVRRNISQKIVEGGDGILLDPPDEPELTTAQYRIWQNLHPGGLPGVNVYPSTEFDPDSFDQIEFRLWFLLVKFHQENTSFFSAKIIRALGCQLVPLTPPKPMNFLNSFAFKAAVAVSSFSASLVFSYFITKWVIDAALKPKMQSETLKPSTVNKNLVSSLKPGGPLWLPERAFQGDPMSQQIMLSIQFNLVRCRVVDTNGTSLAGQLLFLKGVTAIMPRHMVLMMKEGGAIQLVRASKKSVPSALQTYPACDLTCIPLDETDLCIIKFKETAMNPFPDITNHLFRESDYNQYKVVEGVTFISRDADTNLIQKTCSTAEFRNEPVKFTENGDTNTIAEHALISGIETHNGDCGGFYMVANSKVPRKIFAMHSARTAKGNAYVAIGSLLTYERIVKYTKEDPSLKIVLPNVLETVPVEHQGMIDDLPNGTVLLGAAQKAAFLPKKSKIVPSILGLAEGTEGSYTIPAALKPFKVGDAVISPLKNAYLKSPVACSGVEMPFEDIADSYGNEIPKAPAKTWILDWGECVRGRPGLNFIEPIDLSTSAGFPYCLDGIKRNQLIHLEEDGSVQFDPKFYEELTELDSNFRKGIFEVPIFIDCLKDERRPREKVAAGNTRLFNAGSLALLLVARKYFAVFSAAIEKDCWKFGPAVGINVHSSHWKALHTVMKKFHKHGAADAKNYDVSLLTWLGKAFERVVRSWLRKSGIVPSEEDWNAVRCVILSIFMHAHIIGFLVYLRLMGNTSGHYLTAIFNSVALVILLSLAFKLLIFDLMTKGANCSFSWSLLREHVTMHTYGDDMIFGVSEAFAPFYTMTYLKSFFAKFYGMTLTSPDKRSEMPEFMNLSDITFLKRSFVQYEGLVLAPLEEYVVKDMVLWVTDKNRRRELSQQNIDTVALEWFHFGPARYKVEISSLNQRLVDLPLTQIVQTWNSVLERYCTRSEYQSLVIRSCVAKVSCETLPSTYCVDLYGSDCFSPSSREFPDKRCNKPTLSGINFIAEKTHVSTQIDPANPQLATSERTHEEQSSLTLFSESAVSEERSHPDVRLAVFPTSNPFPIQNMEGVINRKYPIGSFSWSASSPFGTLLETYRFPQNIAELTNVAEKLRTYRYLRAGVKVEFRINSTQFHYGALMVSNIASSTTVPQDIYQASGCRPIIISASSQTAITFDLPWLYPGQYCDLDKSNGSSAIGNLYVYVLVPLGIANATASDTISVSVFASFENVEIAGYITGGATTAAKRSKLKVEYQSDAEGVSKSIQGIIAGVTEATRTVQGLMTAANAMAPLAAEALNKPSNMSSLQHVGINYGYDMISGKGLDNAVRLALDPQAIVSVDPAIVGPENSQTSLSGIWSIPTILATGFWTNSKAVGTMIDLFDCNPSACETEGVPPNYTKYHMTYLAFVTRCFMRWRGSIKYKFQFFCSSFTSARIRITYFPPGVDPDALDLETSSGDVISAIVDIKGDTEFDFVIPYLSPTLYRPIVALGGGNAVGDASFCISVVNTSQTVDAASDATVQYVLWTAGGEDFQVQQYRSYDITAYTNSLPNIGFHFFDVYAVEYQSVVESFKKPFAGLNYTSNLVMEHHIASPESITALNTCLHRYSAPHGPPVAGITALPYLVFASGDPQDNLAYFSMIFRFWKGSLRYKTLATNAGTWYVSFDSFSLNEFGFVPAFGPMKNIVDTEVPWYQLIPFAEMGSPIDTQIQAYPHQLKCCVTDSTPLAAYWSRAVGEDFCLNHPIGVPPLSYTAPAPKGAAKPQIGSSRQTLGL